MTPMTGTVNGNQESSPLNIIYHLCESDFRSGDRVRNFSDQTDMDPYKHGFPLNLPILTKIEQILISHVHVVMNTLFLKKPDYGVSRVRRIIYNKIQNNFPTVFLIYHLTHL